MNLPDVSQFHFLRPWWLLGLLALPAILAWWRRRRSRAGAWARVCDPALMPHVLVTRGPPGGGRWSRWSGAPLIAATALALLAMAGPAWKRLPQPVYKQKSALVIALDLSQSMDATDITPSRLARARFKLADILKRRREGQTALLVYAADAFVVTPLTDDTGTILSQVPVLTTDLMPAQGSNPAAAVRKAEALLTQAGVGHGDILLITDGVRARDIDPVESAIRGSGDRLSFMGVGTTAGAPVPARDGGFIEDGNGKIVIARLDEAPLRKLASFGHGLYVHMAIDDKDVNAIADLLRQNPMDIDATKTDLKSDRWREEGPWLLLALLPLAALAFRRGVLIALVVLVVLPWPRHASAFEWRDLWLRPDQQAARLLKDGDAKAAAARFQDHRWQAAADYRAGDYDKAIEALGKPDNANDHYNRGNALARMGKYKEAVAAYDRALRLNPKDEDARYNRDLLEKEMQKQQKPEQGKSGKQNQQDRRQSNQQQGGQPNRSDQSKGKSKRNQADRQKPGPSDNRQDNRNKAGNGADKQQGQQHEQPQAQAKKEQDKAKQQNESQARPKPGDQGRRQAKADESGRKSHEKPTEADEQWLRRIPDDPGGLLRRKFYLQYSQRHENAPSDQPW